jgi:hypothetical protein
VTYLKGQQMKHDRRTILQMAAALPFGIATGAVAQTRAPVRPAMRVYRDPGCGCCTAWAAVARRAGFDVTVENVADMAALKARLGVPAALASCHTTVVAGLVVEGHVPIVAIDRLLAAPPRGIIGIAVPGMPVGSPGMEAPSGEREPFSVYAFDRAGRSRRF